MSTYTSSLGLEEITPGDQAGLWGNTTNNNLALIDQAVTGVTPISFTGLSSTVYTLTSFDGAVDEARASVLNITGIATGSNTVVVPNKQKTYLVRNDTGQNVIFRTASPSATYTVGAGNSILIFCDGNNNVFTGIASPSVGTLGVAGGGTGYPGPYTAGFVKTTGGTNAFSSSATVNLASEVSGVLTVDKGGTGAGTFTSGSLIVGNGASPLATIAGSAAGQVLTYNGSSWVPRASGLTPGSYTSTNITVNSEGLITAISTGTGGSGVASVAVTSPIVNNGTPTAPNIGISATPSFTTVTTTGNITTSSGDLRATSGQIGVGTIGSLTYSALVGSSVQLFNGNSSIFGNNVGSVGIIANGATPMVGNNLAMGPGGDNTFSCGSSGLRWTAVWAVNGTIQTSDSRLKTNVTPSPLGLNFISKLKPVSYKWISGAKVEDGTTTPTQVGGATVDMKNYKDRPGVRTHYGLIAQEVKQTLDELNVDDFAGWALENKDDPNSTQALNYGQFIAPLIKAVQELKTELDAAKAEIAALKAK